MRKIPVLILSALAPFFLASPGGAQTASLVADLNTAGTPENSFDSNPMQLTPSGTKLYFSAGRFFQEIWVTDGTSAGTKMLAETCIDGCGVLQDPVLIGGVGGRAVFAAGSPAGLRVWVSDGTEAGSVALEPGGEPLLLGEDSHLGTANFASTGRAVYFQACTATAGCEAWRSDGTVAGTHPLGDLVPGSRGSHPTSFMAVGTRVFFVSHDNGENSLWQVAGTASPILVKRFSVPPGPHSLVSAGNRFFFLRDNEVWTSDGTPQGTRFLRKLDRHSGWLPSFGGRIYFKAYDPSNGEEIWTSDGTQNGTRRITNTRETFPYDSIPGFAELGARVVFTGFKNGSGKLLSGSRSQPATTPADLCGTRCEPRGGGLGLIAGRVLITVQAGSSMQLWSTDGTREGTGPVKEICARCDAEGAPAFLPFGGGLLFNAAGALWRTDGTPGGTSRLTESDADVVDSDHLEAVGPRAFFIARSSYGLELWTTDGTPGGTRIVQDIVRDPGSSQPSNLMAAGDRLFFTACEERNAEVWEALNGFARDLAPGIAVSGCGGNSPLLFSQGSLFFWGHDGDFQQRLWKTDGTPAGLQALAGIGSFAFLPELEEFKGRIYYIERTGPQSAWVMTTNGTPEGTGKAFDLPPGADAPLILIPTQEHLYILTDHEIWSTSDGTSATLQRLHKSEHLVFRARYRAVGSVLYIFMGSGAGTEMWKTDGTPAGTARVRILPGFVEDTVEYQGALHIIGGDPDGAWGLWRSDGTAAGTVLAVPLPPELNPGQFRLYPYRPNPVVYAGKIFFVNEDPQHGGEIWSSDGTVAGTRRLLDLFPGPEGSRPSQLTVAGGKLFFSAHDGTHGFELWQTDGTPGGTRLVQDLAPGALSSSPQEITAVGDRLYFSATNDATGRELWSLPLAVEGCQPSRTQLCLNGGRYKVELFWRNFQGFAGRGEAVGLTPDTGYFWFFDDDNVETVVKVLDGQPVNGHVWVYYGALTNIEYTLVVTDTQTGLTRHYFNPLKQFGSAGDAFAFGPLGAKEETFQAPPSPRPGIRSKTSGDASGTCQPSPTRLCLRENRFAVEVAWTDFNGENGPGHAVGLTGDTGYFWFFNDANVELVLKVLDAQLVNGKFWVFYGALSDVGYTITVTDTVTGRSKTYENPKGSFASFGDTEAF